MNSDCAWFTSNLEAYCCDTLDEPGRHAAKEHLNQCRSCRNEIDAFENVDSVVQQVFQYRLANATAKRASHNRILPVAIGASALAAALLLAVNMPVPDTPMPAATELAPPAFPAQELVSAAAVDEPKNTVEPPIQRAKPDEGSATGPQPRPDLDAARTGGPEFAVIDAAGYSTNLENYKGYFVVMGIWSGNQPDTVETMNRIYSAFGHDQQVRVLGVASARQEPLDRATFPVVFNKGSHLFGLKTGEFVLIDKSGHQRWNGSLHQSPDVVVSRIKSEIESRR